MAAAALVGISGLAAGAVAALGTREPAAAPAPIEPVPIASAPAPSLPSPEGIEDEDAAGPSEARALAREARQLLRRGRPRAALRRARRAARLRPGVPYYQVVLGDALAADGQEAAARRAYRRALRMRPGYRAAAERLERSRPGS
ncbi:MAG TPA: hypothetical protein VIL20_30925 [Sandaracinaceae bacterium]